MNIYQTGLIGEAIHQKIENTKAAVKGGQRTNESFSDILRSLMTGSEFEKPKTVASAADNVAKVPSGSSIIYALTNAQTDDTAAAVLGNLGIGGTKNTLSTDSESLLSAITLLNTLQNSDKEQITAQLLKFTERYNALLTSLTAQGTSSSYMYSSLLRTAVKTADEQLASAGITADADGKLSFSPDSYEKLDISGFLATVSSAVSSVNTYASTIKNSSGLLDFLTGEDESDNDTVNYMTSLMNLYI